MKPERKTSDKKGRIRDSYLSFLARLVLRDLKNSTEGMKEDPARLRRQQ